MTSYAIDYNTFFLLLNLDFSMTCFAKALVFLEFASYFPVRGSVAQLDRAPAF